MRVLAAQIFKCKQGLHNINFFLGRKEVKLVQCDNSHYLIANLKIRLDLKQFQAMKIEDSILTT